MFKRSIFLTSILCLLLQSPVFGMARIPTTATAGLATRATEFIPSISQKAPTMTSTEFRSTLNPETIQNIAKTMYVSGGFRPSQEFFDQMMINKAAQELTEEELEILRLLNSTQRSLSRAASSRGAFRRTTPKLFRATPKLFMSVDQAREVLGVSNNATKQEINKAFKIQIQKHHPDHAIDKEKAHAQTLAILEARNVLLTNTSSDTNYQSPEPEEPTSSKANTNTKTNYSSKKTKPKFNQNILLAGGVGVGATGLAYGLTKNKKGENSDETLLNTLETSSTNPGIELTVSEQPVLNESTNDQNGTIIAEEKSAQNNAIETIDEFLNPVEQKLNAAQTEYWTEMPIEEILSEELNNIPLAALATSKTTMPYFEKIAESLKKFKNYTFEKISLFDLNNLLLQYLPNQTSALNLLNTLQKYKLLSTKAFDDRILDHIVEYQLWNNPNFIKFIKQNLQQINTQNLAAWISTMQSKIGQTIKTVAPEFYSFVQTGIKNAQALKTYVARFDDEYDQNTSAQSDESTIIQSLKPNINDLMERFEQ